MTSRTLVVVVGLAAALAAALGGCAALERGAAADIDTTSIGATNAATTNGPAWGALDPKWAIEPWDWDDASPAGSALRAP